VNRESLKDFAELVGIAAIVASLILVAIELKQNTDMTRAQIIQSRAETAVELAESFYNSAYIPDIFIKAGAGGNLTPEERARYTFWIRASLRNQDNNLQQYNQGLLAEHIPRAVASAAQNIIGQNEISRDYWNRNKRIFSDEFIAFVDEALSAE